MKSFSLHLCFLTILISSLNLNASTVDDWGATGHRVVGEIAQKYLKGKAKREVNRLLKQHSLAFASTYGDEIKSDKAYDKYYTWHFVNMPFNETYETSEKHPDGDLVTGIETCKAVLLDKNASDEDKIFHLKMLIHLMGDLHQPMHVGLAEDKGGNDLKVQWFYKDSNLHRVWDSDMIEDYKMGYDELANNADALSKDEIKAIQEGSVTDWVNETHNITKKVYASVEPNENLRYRYSYDHFKTVRSQLQIAGIRLAKVLNDIF
ncbi:S1/P1 nuclease [Aestuariibaculum suncheonense]|uniref:S1/P1 nuclease n=1 Tax=Aestuariibaculum suncheonense TaxID=1028745 RepID=A0A8J6QJ15_9FLAO|nr:S1/P1 nuclease [Aestuariibaculum suncheonense]MBD0835866.1 S1/P1 nuclease [Aestuariibaculum suncheonense]